MKINYFVIALLMAGLLAFAGTACHKQTSSSDKPKTLADGMAALQAALTTASPQVHSNYYVIYLGVRYGDYAKATSAVQQLASDPSLSDQQKKAVSTVSDLLAQQAASQPAH